MSEPKSAPTYQTYQNNKVETSSPAELTLMLYNGALKFSGLAKKAMNDGHIAESNTKGQGMQLFLLCCW